MRPFTAGLLVLAIVATGTWFAFAQTNPFADPFELEAVFETTNNLRTRSPVRTAGVKVGTVTKIEPIGHDGAARVTMEIDDAGLPLHRDAELKIRPRIFLEGNFFVELEPGSPSAPVVGDGHTIPANQTATPVQFDELLGVLESDVRTDLQVLLREYSKGLAGPGARGFRRSIRYWEPAYRSSALASEAALGTRPHDLSRLLRGQARVFGALARDERALMSLVTSLDVTAAAFAREDDALQAAIPELREVLRIGVPALASLDRALPSVRAFARDALPGVRSSGPTLDAALPFVRQARRLVADDELRGLARELRPAVPDLVRLATGSVDLFEQLRLLSSCQNEVLLPFATTPIPDPDFEDLDGEPFYKSVARGLVGLAGESRLHDANSPIQRAAFSVGAQEIGVETDAGQRLFGTSLYPMLGSRPARPNRRPDARPDVPCETQEPPDLNAPVGRTEQNLTPQPRITAASRERRARAQSELDRLLRHLGDDLEGLPTIDPLRFDERGLRLEARRRKAAR